MSIHPHKSTYLFNDGDERNQLRRSLGIAQTQPILTHSQLQHSWENGHPRRRWFVVSSAYSHNTHLDAPWNPNQRNFSIVSIYFVWLPRKTCLPWEGRHCSNIDEEDVNQQSSLIPYTTSYNHLLHCSYSTSNQPRSRCHNLLTTLKFFLWMHQIGASLPSMVNQVLKNLSIFNLALDCSPLELCNLSPDHPKFLLVFIWPLVHQTCCLNLEAQTMNPHKIRPCFHHEHPMINSHWPLFCTSA